MAELLQEFTSTGSKLFWHQEAMQKLRGGKGVPIVTHIMPTDVCNFKCAFCSVQYREGDSLPMDVIRGYMEQLLPLGLKAVIISGGGNPILYKNKGADFNALIDYIHGQGLEIGLITNGMPMVKYPNGRTSWKTVSPETLDKLTWVRLSLAGFDHPQDECDTPDIDPTKTTLGASYVLHDIYEVPGEERHGKVSTEEDLIRLSMTPVKIRYGTERIPRLKEQLTEWSNRYHPAYCRLLPNCLEPELIPQRAKQLQQLANEIDPNIFFVQVKPPRQPKACYKIAVHPVLNCDGWCYSCDSVVLNKTANHKFGSAWRVARWDKIGEYFSNPLKPSVPNNICPGCVFSDQVDLITSIVEDGAETPIPTGPHPEHVNFV